MSSKIGFLSFLYYKAKSLWYGGGIFYVCVSPSGVKFYISYYYFKPYAFGKKLSAQLIFVPAEK